MKWANFFFTVLLSITGAVCILIASGGWITLSATGVARYNLHAGQLYFSNVITYWLWSFAPSFLWFMLRRIIFGKHYISEKFMTITNRICRGYSAIWIFLFAIGIARDYKFFLIYLESITAVLFFGLCSFLDFVIFNSRMQ